jgi:hypothetical protein
MYKTFFFTLLVLFSLEACQYYSQSKQKYQAFPQPYSQQTPKAKVVIDVSNDSSDTNYHIDTTTAPFTILIKESDMKNDSLITLVGRLIGIMEKNSNASPPIVPASNESDLRFAVYVLGLIVTFASRFVKPENIEKLKLILPHTARALMHIKDAYNDWKSNKKINAPKQKEDEI